MDSLRYDVGSDTSSFMQASDIDFFFGDPAKKMPITIEMDGAMYVDDHMNTTVEWQGDASARIVMRRTDPIYGQRNIEPIAPFVNITNENIRREQRPRYVSIHPMDDVYKLIEEEACRIDEGDEYEGRIRSGDFPRNLIYGECTRALRRILHEWRLFRDMHMDMVRLIVQAKMDGVTSAMVSDVRRGADKASERDLQHESNSATLRKLIRQGLFDKIRSLQKQWAQFAEVCAYHRDAVAMRTFQEEESIERNIKLLARFTNVDPFEHTSPCGEEGSTILMVVEALWNNINQRRENARLYRDIHTQAYMKTIRTFQEHACYTLGVYHHTMQKMRSTFQDVHRASVHMQDSHNMLMRNKLRTLAGTSRQMHRVLEECIENLSGCSDVRDMFAKWSAITPGVDVEQLESSCSSTDDLVQRIALDYRRLKGQVHRMQKYISGLSYDSATEGLISVGLQDDFDDYNDQAQAAATYTLDQNNTPFAGESNSAKAAAPETPKQLSAQISKLEGELSQLHASLETVYTEILTLWDVRKVKSLGRPKVEAITLKCRNMQQEICAQIGEHDRKLQQCVTRLAAYPKSTVDEASSPSLTETTSVNQTQQQVRFLERQLDTALHTLRTHVRDTLMAHHGLDRAATTMRDTITQFASKRQHAVHKELERAQRELQRLDRVRNDDAAALRNKEQRYNELIETLFELLRGLKRKMVSNYPQFIEIVSQLIYSLKVIYSYGDLLDCIDHASNINACAKEGIQNLSTLTQFAK